MLMSSPTSFSTKRPLDPSIVTILWQDTTALGANQTNLHNSAVPRSYILALFFIHFIQTHSHTQEIPHFCCHPPLCQFGVMVRSSAPSKLWSLVSQKSAL
ncbi:UNVERIFIED_CONTAM: hypothetical protein K2H54_065399 [Gekko kuhli]